MSLGAYTAPSHNPIKCRIIINEIEHNSINLSRISQKVLETSIWRHWPGSTLIQIMACCLTAPSYYLNKCWLITIKVQRHSSGDNLTRDTSAINHWNKLENHLSKIVFKSPRGHCVNSPTDFWWLRCVRWPWNRLSQGGYFQHLWKYHPLA